MHRIVRGLLFASAAPFLIVPPAILNAIPAQAQPADISFDSFHDQLNNYGDWLYSDRWGEVWRPWQQDQSSDWRPYSVGHWVYTSEYGWTWISDEGAWGDIAYHYGRWVYDPDDGWLWLTGYVWSPAWVVWRSAGPNVGWMPMPPDDNFLGVSSPGLSVNVNFGDWGDTGGLYGYARWYGPRFDENRFGSLWTFVPTAHVADPVYRNYVVPRPQVVNIVRVSHNVTNYTVVNNIVINKSVNITMVQGAGGHPLVPVHAAAVLKTTRWVAPVTRGQQVQAQMRQVHPRGNGQAGSAPTPTPQQIRTLSAQPRGGQAAAGGAQHHLFSQANVAQIKTTRPAPNTPAPANAPAMPRPAAQPAPGMTAPANAPTMPRPAEQPAPSMPAPANAPAIPRPAAQPAPQRAPANEAPRPPRDLSNRGPATPQANAPQHPPQESDLPRDESNRAPVPPTGNRPAPAPNEDRSFHERPQTVSPPPRPAETLQAQPPSAAQARPPRPDQTMQPQTPHQPPPLPKPAVQPKPAPHPQGEHAGPKPEQHDDEHKQDH